jgi:hypothetical protein
MEGSGKCVELTMKYKNFEWAIACGHGDYEGHHSNSEASRRPHYHFQMRIDQKRYIDYADFHIPLHHSDILKIEAERAVPGFVTSRFAGGIGMAEVLNEETVERLATMGRATANEQDGLMALTHIVEAGDGQPMRVEDVLAAARRAAQEGRPATSFLREIPSARVSTIATPGAGVVNQAVRRGRGKGTEPQWWRRWQSSPPLRAATGASPV